MVDQQIDVLKEYAERTKTKVFATQQDLDAYHILEEMLPFCIQRREIIVLTDGRILTSQPTSRLVQNCKTVMLGKGLMPGKVLAAQQSLVDILLANAQGSGQVSTEGAEAAVSDQQHRLRLMVQDALKANVSDIHLEVRQNYALVKFRRNGELALHAQLLANVGKEIASVAFNKETDNATSHFNPLIPQNASMPLMIENQEVRLRLASLPAHGGFDVVMRVLSGINQQQTSLEKLGYLPTQVYLLKQAITKPSGAIIISGPTGSGKTTTLACAIALIDPHKKIYTIEDPVEKLIPNATQIPVNTEFADRSFASMARATLRMDPDVVSLGEVRDEDTANIMVRAAFTGHLVFCTLHTNSAIGNIARLSDLGVVPGFLADPNFLLCLVYQRLIVTLCPHCALPLNQSPCSKEQLAMWEQAVQDIQGLKFRGPGCEHCESLGVSGRRVVAEVVWVDESVRDFIKQQDMFSLEQYLRKQGWRSHQDYALDLMKAGIADPRDVEQIIGKIDPALQVKTFDYRSFAERHHD